MSLIQIDYSEDIRREKLDLFLAQGWFRSSFLMYKSPILCLNGSISTVINIRLDLATYEAKKRHRKLLNKNGKKYQVTFSPAFITPQAEELYQLNKPKFKGFIHPTLHGYLYASAPHSPFETYQIEVHEQEKLVAISFVDLGNDSMASILGLYDPEYAKDSLGIYTMLLELIEAKEMGLKWYYPGYTVDGDASFNYKLSLGDFQFMKNNFEWIDYNKIDHKTLIGRKFLVKMQHIQNALIMKNGDKKLIYSYPHFSIGFIEPYQSQGFLDKPAFIRISNSKGDYILSYNIDENVYTLELITDEPIIENFMVTEISEEFVANTNCWTELILTESIGSFSDLSEMLEMID